MVGIEKGLRIDVNSSNLHVVYMLYKGDSDEKYRKTGLNCRVNTLPVDRLSMTQEVLRLR